MPGTPPSVIDLLKDPRARAAGDPVGTSARQQFCGDIDMRIGRDGTWFYHGSPIGRKPLVKLFASILQRDNEGDYWLVTPVERGKIKVEDVPFTAVEVTAAGSGRSQSLTFRTNLDDEVTADAIHPIRVSYAPGSEEPRPYILVRDGLEARILRPVFYELVELGEVRRSGGEEVYGIWSREQFFPLGRCGSAA
ncbi:MAG: DUF1285 domain-containing protein [Dongiaceae bacterium]